METENRYQEQYLETALQYLERQEEQAALVRATHHQHLLDQMALVERICVQREENGVSPEMEECAAIAELEKASFSNFILVIDREGSVLLSSDESQVGKTLSQLGILSEEQRNSLNLAELEQTDDPQPVSGQWNGERCDLYFLRHNCTLSEGEAWFVFGESGQMLESELAVTLELAGVEQDIWNGMYMAFLADLEHRTFLWSHLDSMELEGKPLSDYGISLEALEQGKEQVISLGGRRYRLTSRVLSSESRGKVALIHAADVMVPLLRLRDADVTGSLGILDLVSLLGLFYAFQLRRRYLPGDPQPVNGEVLRRTGAFFCCGLLLFAGIGAYVNTYAGISHAMEDSDGNLEVFEGSYDYIQTNVKTISGYYENQVESLAKLISLWAEERADRIFNWQDADRDNLHRYNETRPGETKLFKVLDDRGEPIRSQLQP